MRARTDARSIDQQQQRHGREEIISCVRALLMTPLMSPTHDEFASVRRRADALRDWFARETGWALHIARDGARLFKRPATLVDATRGLPKYDRRRYALLCLACAVLERAEPQITLRVLGERLLLMAAEPDLATSGFTFTLGAQHERGELVAVCRTLLELGVLLRVAGDEEGFVRAGADMADALYDVGRRALSGMLAAVRGPSTWPLEEAPIGIEARLRALVDEHVADSDEARRTAIRHHLSRRLLDDPVIYVESLDDDARAYFVNQRGALAARLGDSAGLGIEQRAEGLALVDESGDLTDVAMPAEGTDAHATLLVADFLATSYRNARTAGRNGEGALSVQPIHEEAVRAFLARAKDDYGRYWRKSAREPGGEDELTEVALDRLAKLALIARDGREIRPLPALARFALGAPEAAAMRPRTYVQPDLLLGGAQAT
jgi:uncharacterized protein (TIGR02678 family)